MLDRSPKYQAKFLAQELSLMAKVWSLAGPPGPDDKGGLAVVDIGAGNGCLALLTASLLGAYAVLVDHTLPPDELRVECKVPDCYRRRILRITGDVADLDVRRDLESLLERHKIRRAVVVAKHLCGLGTDLAMGLVSRWRLSEGDGAQVELLGAVFATCCSHKIGSVADRCCFGQLHKDDAHLSRLTDGDTSRLEALLAICTRYCAWRTTAVSQQSRVIPNQVRLAELFEDALQQPRLNTLRRLFPVATEVAFVPAAHSPQNRCLLAGSPEAVFRAKAPDGETFIRQLQATRDRWLADLGAPLDLKPKGFVSARYDYDGS
eukprot:gnl/TRDRNA2_/TRDRNA2_74638_c1_seq1.p1 gnl/TRDRNA2_/TRDRNA2_74638_c1~~gnl/TRDRNA2_/TRDRNA2_74638_c1_seq1.p1  ORF type:complete len:320 (+),score=37.96 gnl/TRDRNA2_/TRDRNA2_74638_c1_seq1:1-960(+)